MQDSVHIKASDLPSQLSLDGLSALGAQKDQSESAFHKEISSGLFSAPVTAKGGFGAVFSDVAHGAWSEITEHPLTLLKDAAVGAVLGAGAVLVGPELALAGGAVLAVAAVEANGGFIKTAKDIGSGVANLAHDTAVVYAPQSHSVQDQVKAKTGLENAGAVGTDVTAGVLGGLAGGVATGAIRAAFAGGQDVLPPLSLVDHGDDGGDAGGGGGGDAGGGGAAGSDVPSHTVTGHIAAAGEGAKTSTLSNGHITLETNPEAIYSHADVNAGILTNPDGSEQDVFFHGADKTPALTAARLAREQAGYNLNKIIGFDNSYPQSEAVTLNVGGITRDGWVQESAGPSVEGLLNGRAMLQFQTTANMNEDVASILANDPALQAQVQQAVVERLVYGDLDIAPKNIGISGAGARNFDLGEAFGTNTTPELTSIRSNLTTIGMQNAMSDQPLTPALSQTLKNFLTRYDNPTGIESLQKIGLNEDQVTGVLGRTKWLVDNGRLPSVNPEINDPANIAWYRLE